MILYTIIPQEAVFATDPEVYASQMMIDYEGVPLMVQKEEEKIPDAYKRRETCIIPSCSQNRRWPDPCHCRYRKQ